MKNHQILFACFGLSLLTACQSQQLLNKQTVNKQIVNNQATPVAKTTYPVLDSSMPDSSMSKPVVIENQTPKNFHINGKIGLTTPTQAGSAFYAWTQRAKNFAIELSGVLNAGQTNITFNSKTATLTNATGKMTADNPEELLQKATGWQAPISQLSYWVMGEPAPSDSEHQSDDFNRLTVAKNGEWVANFSYKNTENLPNRVTMHHPGGYKVVLTINRLD
ncbi:outer membrane lipoprotein LolB [Moraxella macacae 0408225]|uniref:Outer-membrane lipoprotein LolB n=1 Tax=Moraxella macacae 0408225 TaxID=1230338 RepID=L2F8M6_9GAMM|nr:lipoprotein insertase outer membrane protein LolB [Moraxella macacae]ELA09091.1 outer membrane lipoprotein LolB [Moraxella macacae 0408225]